MRLQFRPLQRLHFILKNHSRKLLRVGSAPAISITMAGMKSITAGKGAFAYANPHVNNYVCATGLINAYIFPVAADSVTRYNGKVNCRFWLFLKSQDA